MWVGIGNGSQYSISYIPVMLKLQLDKLNYMYEWLCTYVHKMDMLEQNTVYACG